ncbi:hypothetical protein [Mariniluteicoccus flavus]
MMSRRGVLLASAAIAGLAACTKAPVPRLPERRTPADPPSPAGPSAFEEPGSVGRAMEAVHARAGGGDRFGFTVGHDELKVTCADKVIRWSPSEMRVDPGARPPGLPIDVDAWPLTSWPELKPRLTLVLNGADGATWLEVANRSSWGLPLGRVRILTHHGPTWGVQVDAALRPIPKLDFGRAEDVDRARRELAELAGVAHVSQYLVHSSNLVVVAPWSPRFGTGPTNDRVSVHRGADSRDSYVLVDDHEPAPEPPHLFPLTAVDQNIIVRGREEMGAASDNWRGIVQRRNGALVYRVEVSGQAREFDERGNRI